MAKKRLSKVDLVEALSLHVDVGTKAAATRIIDFIFDEIKTQVSEGNAMALPGFGKFVPFTRSNGEVTPKFRAFGDFKTSLSTK